VNNKKYFSPTLAVGASQRWVHEECSAGKDPALVVTRYPTGWAFLCHRCGWKGWQPIKGLPPDQTIKLLKQTQQNNTQQKGSLKLPDDVTPILPPECWAWLMQYDITEDEARRYRFCYSPRLTSLILPIYRENRLIYYQARSFGPGNKQKYLNVKGRARGRVFFVADKIRDDDRRVVLVEDIVSAIKVNRVTNAMALLYSHIPMDLVIKLIKRNRDVIIWLDHDKQHVALRCVSKARSWGYPVRMIDTPADPKCYDPEAIEKILS